MGLTVSDIAAVIEEITPALTGGWIQKIHQPAPETITLEIRTPGQTLSLLMSAHPETARFHLRANCFPTRPRPRPFASFSARTCKGHAWTPCRRWPATASFAYT